MLWNGVMTDSQSSLLERLRRRWAPVRVGRRINWSDEVVSTNSALLEQAGDATADVDGSVILADHQTNGRGRLGRRWLSPRGASILCSVAIVEANSATDDERSYELAGRLNMLAAVVAAEAVAECTELQPAIKWPNDLRIGGRKVGGILIESRSVAGGFRAYVIGFGINCLQHAGHFPAEFADEVTSLEIASAHPVDRVAVARALLMRLDRRLSQPNWRHDAAILDQWEHLSEPLGRRLTLRCQGLEYLGRTVCVDPIGGLTLQLDNGRQMWFDPLLTSVV